ncbi:MAG TPA: RNA polymerase sigma factor, partial [Verrucomicrobiae bacterium]|nr:RNA polymerase sigma factor [Verrucomicrobiae bacterium]
MVIMDALPKLPDEQALLVRARAGETEAFCHLISPLQARLLRQAAALAGDVSTAEDLVSETLVEAWKSLPRYNQNCRFSTWLYSILLHRHWKSLRHARRRPLAFAWLSFFETRDLHERQENLPSPEPSPAEMMTENETGIRLRQCLERLPQPHRQVVLLRFFEDASLTEIAGVLGCSVGTVKSRLHHALEKLRQMKMNLP